MQLANLQGVSRVRDNLLRLWNDRGARGIYTFFLSGVKVRTELQRWNSCHRDEYTLTIWARGKSTIFEYDDIPPDFDEFWDRILECRKK